MRWTYALVAVLSLLAGAGAGISTDRIVLGPASCLHQEALCGDPVGRLSRELDLDEAQLCAVEDLGRRSREAIAAIRDEALRGMRAERQGLRSALRESLREDQRSRLDALCAEAGGFPAGCAGHGDGAPACGPGCPAREGGEE
ncbi:MAG: hypothetical protein HY722_10810 [Planctomycetes bacterium]|nr:hypothetical protein [Planctomycetota bacterium]